VCLTLVFGSGSRLSLLLWAVAGLQLAANSAVCRYAQLTDTAVVALLPSIETTCDEIHACITGHLFMSLVAAGVVQELAVR
jgi:hypothetical protein